MPSSTAKLFATGGSQAVRLPADYRFEGANEVYIRRDESTGDVILSARPPADWCAFMRLRDEFGAASDDFLTQRQQQEQGRDPFEGWTE